MKTRFFSFGCSFTRWTDITWADLIGVNYPEYYNYSQAGSSNTLIYSRFIEALDYHKFNPETDVVMIAVTGVTRLSYLFEKEDIYWVARGDIMNYDFPQTDFPEVAHAMSFLKNKLWKPKFGIYQSWLALKAMKTILESMKIEHKIISALYDKNLKFDELMLLKKYHDDIDSLLDVKESLHQFNNFSLHHPSAETHYQFLEKYLPEYLTDKSKKLLVDAAEFLKTHESVDQMEICKNPPNSTGIMFGTYY